MLEKDVDINMRDGDGATPLHFAASRGHVQMVRWLLRHGSKIVLDKYGKSPINDAAENERIEVGYTLSSGALRYSNVVSSQYILKTRNRLYLVKCIFKVV